MSNKSVKNNKDVKAKSAKPKVQYAEFPPPSDRVEPPLGRSSPELIEKFKKDYPEYANTLKRRFG